MLIKFPSIEQFRHAVDSVRRKAQFAGLDENNYPLYDETRKLPTLECIGTVKLHGTNASVYRNQDGRIICQSRSRIVSYGSDNAGFAAFVQKKSEVFHSLLDKANNFCEDKQRTVLVYGELVGQGINKGCGIHKLPPMFVIFAVRLYLENEPSIWLTDEKLNVLSNPEHNIYTIQQFKTYNITIDFNNPEQARDELERLTLEVEQQCPVAKALGVDGIGEGIVWRINHPDYSDAGFWFKTKGDKHKVTSTKAKIEMSPEKAANIEEFVSAVLTEARLEQGLDYLREHHMDLSRKSTGEYLKWIVADVFKEETDRLVASGLDGKEANKSLSVAARRWFFKKVDIV